VTRAPERSPERVDWPSFVLGAGILVGFSLYALFDLPGTKAAVDAGLAASAEASGLFWQLLLPANFAVAIALAASPRGRVRLGGDDPPEMPFPSWLAVILCTLLAGGGVFWSAAEPMMHFVSPPPVFADAATSQENSAVGPAFAQSFFHWGVLPWAMVGTLGAIVLLRLSDDRGLPLKPRTLLVPLLGEGAVRGPIGTVVDVVSILAALAGTVGPVGFLALQLSYSGHRLFGWPDALPIRLAVLGALIAVATTSSVSGVSRGIRWLSRFNVWLTLGLGLSVLVVGPTPFIGEALVRGAGFVVQRFPEMALFREDAGWLRSWTVFYWGWFIGYGPLMSLFVARISRGRTVRELVLTVGVLCPLLTNVWFAILGGAGVSAELETPGSVSSALDEGGPPAALFAIVDGLPAGELLLPLFLLLIFLFLATSADSIGYGTSVLLSGRLTPPTWMRAFWGIGMGVVTGILLALPGDDGVNALQSVIVITAVPVGVVMATTLVAAPRLLLKPLEAERRRGATASAPSEG